MLERLSNGSVASRVVVHGAGGRMGARLCALALDDPRVELVGAVAREGSALLGRASAGGRGVAVSVADGVAGPADVIVDFSSESGVFSAIALAGRTGAGLLVGTTALGPGALAALRDAAAQRAVLLAPNTSLGAAVLSRVAVEVWRALGEGYDPSLVESHHRAKKDAPSGTAARIARALRDAGCPIRDDQVLAMRGGDVIGEHTVRFAGAGEYLELTHRATSRDVFARGALHAAHWLRGRAPGWYTIEDVLGFTRDDGEIAS